MGTDFLKIGTVKKIKKHMQNICNSYSHPWDIIAELSQNSVDAIKKWNHTYPTLTRKHKIEIIINQKNRSIKIVDTGIGIDPEKASTLLGPDETDKEGSESQIGEKGVGLTFAIFCSNNFEINSKSPQGTYKGKIKSAKLWKNNEDYTDEHVPQIEDEHKEITTNLPLNTGTDILLEDIEINDDKSYDIFYLTSERLIYILRTKTAIGYTGKRFKKGDLEIDVELNLISPENISKKYAVPFEYQFPDEFMDAKDILDIDEYEKIAGNLSDEKKRKKISGKCLKSEGFEEVSGKKYHFFTFFVPSRDTWKDISTNNKLVMNSSEDEDSKNDVNYGIFASTKGMPTGIEIIAPSSGTAGYWNNLFALVECDSIKFDIGRKYIPSRIRGNINVIVKKKFSKFSGLKQLVAKDEKKPFAPIPQMAQLEKSQEIDRLKKEVPNLDFSKISFLKHPSQQEAGVVAIFHELVGSGVLKGYHALREGYKQNYDFWGLYKINKSNLGEKIKKNSNIPQDIEIPLVIEFKNEASSIIADVDAYKKHFIDIDLIVCWDINETEFKKFGIDIKPLKKEDAFFYGSNYVLDWPSTYDLGQASEKHVLCLKRFIEDNIREGN